MSAITRPAFVTASTTPRKVTNIPGRCIRHRKVRNLFDNEVGPNSARNLFLGGVLCFEIVFIPDGEKTIQWWHEIIWRDEAQFALFAMSINVLICEIALQN